VGQLRIPMKARFVINDGQHRRAAIEQALRQNPDLGDETIAVVFFLDVGLKRCQQMFSDLNRYAVRPSTSLNILYDHRDRYADFAKSLLQKVPVFTDLTETGGMIECCG
jgi:DNA sulfur modification protein DndB